MLYGFKSAKIFIELADMLRSVVYLCGRDFRVTPDVGIAYSNLVALTLGYSIHIAGYHDEDIAGPKLTFGIYLDLRKLKSL